MPHFCDDTGIHTDVLFLAVLILQSLLNDWRNRRPVTLAKESLTASLSQDVKFVRLSLPLVTLVLADEELLNDLK